MKEKAIRVLVVDDHDIVRKGICALLDAKEGIEVVAEADNGQEAVVRRALLTRCGADGSNDAGNGWNQATRQISASYPHVRILVLTSFSTDDKVFPAIKAGRWAIFSRPRTTLCRPSAKCTEASRPAPNHRPQDAS